MCRGVRSSTTVLAGMLAVVGCGPQGGTDVGNGATVVLDLEGFEQAPAVQPQALDLVDGTRIDGLWMVVDRVRFRPGADCAGEDPESDVDGPLVADLIGGGFVGGRVSFSVPAGPFCRLRVGFHRLEEAVPAGAPAELAGQSILVRGARADGVPFTVASELGEELELKARGGAFTLPEGESPLVLGYEVGSWIAALDLGGLSGPTILIDKNGDTVRLEAFEAAVKDSAELFKDEDGDGALSPAERAPGSELTEGQVLP